MTVGWEVLFPVICIFILVLIGIPVWFRRPDNLKDELEKLNDGMDDRMDRLEKLINESFSRQRLEMDTQQRSGREEWAMNFDRFFQHQSAVREEQRRQREAFSQGLEQRLDRMADTLFASLKEIREEVSGKIEGMQKDNHDQLEKMRETVDEKLNRTLEERLGRSFRLVQESLERVQQGLGEMQALASGVGDLKKVLSNVKTRGTLGEIQLGNILEQILAREQYGINVATVPNSSNHVEFAIRFPGPDKGGDPVWLPVDSKFPMDRYERLLLSYDEGSVEEIDMAHKELVKTVRNMAREIRDKYISPPYTTEFGILFLPVEGLYADIARQPGLLEELQRDMKIMIAGPGNLAAFLNSLQMGFRSLAIEQRSAEVWSVLGQVKTEFGKFGDLLDRVHKQLSTASNTIQQAGVRTRAIEKKLRNVESLPSGEARDEELPELM